VTGGVLRKASARRPSGQVAVAAVVFVLAFAGAPGVASALTVTGMSPPSGPVGTAVGLTGTGFTGNDAVAFNGIAASAKVNAAGTQLRTVVPAFATSGPVTVADSATGQRASPPAPFGVTAGISVSPSDVWRGGHMTVSGSALSTDKSVPIYASSTRVGSALTDRHGNFKLEVTVPWSVTSGQLQVSAVDPNQGRFLNIVFVLGDWPEFRHDSAHSGVDGFESAIGVANVSKLTRKWLYPTGGAVVSSPAVANGVVYVGSKDGSLYALNAGTGKLLWSYPTGGAITSSPAVANNEVFVYSTGGVFYALRATTGKLIWQRSLGADSNSSPVTSGNNVYVGTHYDGSLDAFNMTTGGMLWNFPTGQPLDSPAVANGLVYVGSQDGHMYAIHASTGVKAWAAATGSIVDSSPALAGGQLYVGTNSGAIYEINSSNGTIAKSTNLDHYPIRTSPAIAGGLVYVGTDSGTEYALSPSTLAVKWKAPLGSPLRSSPAFANGVLYSGGYFHQFGLNPASGATLWNQYMGALIESSPAIANGREYVGSDDQYVYAFGP
jgi:outer membrane protein assembly factor BamB